MVTVLILLGLLLLLVGLVGCVLPVLPGPPISFAGLLLLWWARDGSAATFGWPALVVLGVLTIVVTVLDFVVPAWGAKRYGASKTGVWLSVVGMLVGLVMFPPFGMLVGAFAGALAGELMIGKREGDAARAAWGVFIGTLAGVGLKLAVSLAISVVYVLELFA
ncbi:MAG: DUF456 domain-containing protein [Planctomycetota bacterium]|nr:DUF456 domain-containing protein [Planctomycetota bacterium]